MKTNIMTMAFLLLAGLTTQAQDLTVKCGLAGNLQCDGREIVISLYNPGCGSLIGTTSPLVVWTGDDYTVNLTSLWGSTLPASYEIGSVEVRALTSCGLTPGPSTNPCGYDNGVNVGDPCTGYNTSECYEITANCGPTGGVTCSAGQVTTATYTLIGVDVLLEID